MNLFYQKLGQGPVLIILHGLYGSSDNWITVARKLSTRYTVYLIDLRNHGKSPHSHEHSYTLMAEDIEELITSESIEKTYIIGHSMGGKVAMLYAAIHPEKIAGLIVVDIGPGGYANLSQYSPQVIGHLNIVNAMLSIDLSKFTSRTEIEIELAKTIHDLPTRQFIMKNIDRNKDYSFTWKLNVDAISRSLPAMMGSIYLDKILNDKQLTQFPVLFIKGAHSGYISSDQITLIMKYFPGAQINTIPEAKHWVQAEQPEMFMKALNDFLETQN
jgi:pimeloyl-ACP methyl ester carboxylesterase